MERRALIAGTVGLLAAPLVAGAQQAGKAVPRIGFLGNADPQSGTEPLEAFRQGLRDLGWVEDRTVTIEYRWAYGQSDRVPELVAELVRARSDVLVVSGRVAVRAARQATRRIPIVIAAVLTDPVAAGFVASLARPGGNVTGLAASYEEIATKQVELLAEAIPGLARLVFLRHTGIEQGTVVAAVRAAADTLGLQARLLEVRDTAEYEGAFRAARQGRAQAVHVLPSPYFNAHRRLLIDLAARYRLPAMYEFRDYVRDGGLLSYGASLSDMYRRAASFVDRILKGTKPGDLPVEQPSKYELVVNLRTARALGLTIPPSVLARADEVIE